MKATHTQHPVVSTSDHFAAMDPYSKRPPSRHRRSGAALFTLVLLGCGIIFFGIVLMACSFVINYADDFETSTDVTGSIEETVQSQFNYTQYWAGIPFLVTGVLVICSGTFQRNRGLTITTAIFCIISVCITLFVVSLDGSNWSWWNNLHKKKLYWDSKSGVDCQTSSGSCVCSSSVTIAGFECDEISELAHLFGATVGSSVVVAFFCVFSVLVITKSLSWKRIRYARRGHYNEEFHMDTGRRTPSFIDLPYAKRGGEYVEGPAPPAGPPYKQSAYRSYPY